MDRVGLIVTIVDMKKGEYVTSLFKELSVPLTFIKYGSGTATNEMTEYLGIGEKEKCVLFSTTKLGLVYKIKKNLESNLKGNVFSVLIPISSVGGGKAMEYIGGEEKDNTEDVKYNYNEELIVIIAKRGYVDMVMDVARAAGAGGGTVIHARGTGKENSEKFFGVTVGDEKELIFVLSDKEKKNIIMKAIMEKAGINSEAQSIVFSVPASRLIG